MTKFPSSLAIDVIARALNVHGPDKDFARQADVIVACLRTAGWIIVRHDAIKLAQAHARDELRPANDNKPRHSEWLRDGLQSAADSLSARPQELRGPFVVKTGGGVGPF